jgi:dethiobiotin synthetase
MSSQRVFITGTDTGVGKTLISAWLCTHWASHYWKPIQSGLDDTTDSQWVHTLSGVHTWPERHRLAAPLSPHQSAAREGVDIQLSDFEYPAGDRLLIEGAGGCVVPLNWQHTMLDLMAHLQAPVLLVARSTLGTINHTCLSLQALRARGIPVLGVVLSGPPNPENLRSIEHFGQTTVLGQLPWLKAINRETLLAHPLPQPLLQALNA